MTNDKYDKNWVDYATNEYKSAYFGLARVMIDRPDDFQKRKVEFIINKTKKLNKAKFFVDKWSGSTGEFITKWNR